MKDVDSLKIGTWPTPEKPHVERFNERDKAFLTDLNEVVRKHGIKGSISRIEISSDTDPPLPKVFPKCIRICFDGPDGLQICFWYCR